MPPSLSPAPSKFQASQALSRSGQQRGLALRRGSDIPDLQLKGEGPRLGGQLPLREAPPLAPSTPCGLLSTCSQGEATHWSHPPPGSAWPHPHLPKSEPLSEVVGCSPAQAVSRGLLPEMGPPASQRGQGTVQAAEVIFLVLSGGVGPGLLLPWHPLTDGCPRQGYRGRTPSSWGRAQSSSSSGVLGGLEQRAWLRWGEPSRPRLVSPPQTTFPGHWICFRQTCSR